MAFKIGNVQPHNFLVLAPMAGITNEPFRIICKRMGAGLLVGEMVSDKGLAHQNERTHKMIKVSEVEHPISMQVFGDDYKSITQAAKLIYEGSDADIIDVNMGCPVQKVVGKGAGSALLKETNKIYDIVKSLKENIPLPITIKIRAGWDHHTINCDKVANVATQAGVDAITIHGRTRSQLYRGTSNLEYIKMVREATHVPVIGNGDIKTIEDALRMKEETGVDALMIGRGALGNPWLFKTLDHHFKGLTPPNPPTADEVIDLILEHARGLIALKGERIGIIEMRGHLGWYFRGLPRARVYRPLLVGIKTYQELEKLCFEYLNSLNEFYNI